MPVRSIFSAGSLSGCHSAQMRVSIRRLQRYIYILQYLQEGDVLLVIGLRTVPYALRATAIGSSNEPDIPSVQDLLSNVLRVDTTAYSAADAIALDAWVIFSGITNLRRISVGGNAPSSWIHCGQCTMCVVSPVLPLHQVMTTGLRQCGVSGAQAFVSSVFHGIARQTHLPQ